MVAPLTTTQRIVCTAVRIDEPGVSRSNRLAYKPSALVPWADPYIAGLVRRLQSEVRFERADGRRRRTQRHVGSPARTPTSNRRARRSTPTGTRGINRAGASTATPTE